MQLINTLRPQVQINSVIVKPKRIKKSEESKSERIQIKPNTLINGDGIELVKHIQTESIHAIISDIPYGIGYGEWDVLHNNKNSAYGGQSSAQEKSQLFKRRGKPLNGWSKEDKKIPLEYQEWVSSFSKSWFDVVKPGASIFIFAGRQMAHRVIISLEDAGFTYKEMIAWQRDRAPHRAQRISAVFERRKDDESAKLWKGWRVANPRPLFEPILWFQKPYPIGTTLADNIVKNGVGAWNENALTKYNLNKNVMNQSNILTVNVESSDRGLHETQKPLDLMKLLVELVTVEGQCILDPFAGSGTTLVASKELGRNYIGFEVNKEIHDIAKKRLSIIDYEPIRKNQN